MIKEAKSVAWEITGGTVDVSTIKRCFFPGMVVKAKCPDCGRKISTNMGETYISHPEIGDEENVPLWCEDCEECYSVPLKLHSVKVTAIYDPTAIKRD